MLFAPDEVLSAYLLAFLLACGQRSLGSDVVAIVVLLHHACFNILELFWRDGVVTARVSTVVTEPLYGEPAIPFKLLCLAIYFLDRAAKHGRKGALRSDAPARW